MPFCGTLFLPIFQERMIKMKAKLRKELPYLLFILPFCYSFQIILPEYLIPRRSIRGNLNHLDCHEIED